MYQYHLFFFFKQKTAYEMRISDWSSDVCSSDLRAEINQVIYYGLCLPANNLVLPDSPLYKPAYGEAYTAFDPAKANALLDEIGLTKRNSDGYRLLPDGRSEEHPSELQSLLRISSAVFCLKNKK